MATKPAIRRMIKELGNAHQVYVGLKDFSRRVELMDTKRAELIKLHPDKWVAMHDVDLVAVADTLDEVLLLLDQQGIPRRETIVEYMDTERRNMVL